MSRMWLVGGAACIAVLLIASIVVGLIEHETTFPEDSPEGVVQGFLRAIEDEDFTTAYRFLSSELRDSCSLEEFATGNILAGAQVRDNRITLEGTRDLNGTAIVIARNSSVDGSGLFGSSVRSYELTYTLTREEGEWRLSEPTWPYFSCPLPKRVLPEPPPPNPSTPTPVPTATPAPASQALTSE